MKDKKKGCSEIRNIRYEEKGVGLALHLLLRFVIESLNRLVSIIKLRIEKHKKNLTGGRFFP